MKQVLIIAEGEVAGVFLDFLIEKYAKNNFYTIISSDSAILARSFPAQFALHSFEPTSPLMLLPHLNHHIYFVVMQDSTRRDEVCKIIRKKNKDAPIIVHCEIKAKLAPKLACDANIITTSTTFLTAKSLIEKVPNIPIIARGFGLNKGEIMQITVPFGSAYSYISVGSVLQRGWKIVGIYRQNSFLLAKPQTIILPNDSILAVGDPKVLLKIHRRISSNKNNFPAPYGNDIFAYIDFRMCDKATIDGIVADSLWLHKKIKNDNLVINILNPSNFSALNAIKSLSNDSIRVVIDYSKKNIIEKIAQDSAQKMGLIIAPSEIFRDSKNRKILYRANRPILKVGKAVRLSEIGDSLVLANSPHTQNIAYTIVDISSQLNFEIRLYEFDLDGEYDEILGTYYRNLGRIFNKKVDIVRSHAKNPLFWLGNKCALQFIPLEIALLKSPFAWLLEKNANYLSLFIDKNPQILLPI